jgi:hypothetical protein
MGIAGIAYGQAYYQETPQGRKDIQTRVEDLQQAKAGWDKAQADWTAAQKELTAMNQRVHTAEESSALQKRIMKDTSDMQTYTFQMMSDVSYLKSQWSYLTDKEKELVKQVEQMIA